MRLCRFLVSLGLAFPFLTFGAGLSRAEEPALIKARCFAAPAILRAAETTSSKEGADVIDLAGPAAQRYLDVVNAEPPVSAMKAEHVLLVPHRTGGPTLSIFLAGAEVGCIVGRIRPELHYRALEASQGMPA